MKAILLVTTWLSLGPQVVVQPMEQMTVCRIAMQSTAQMITAQALSNLTGPHRELIAETDHAGDVTLRTPSVAREVARLRCLPVGERK